MSHAEIRDLEKQMYELNKKLNDLRADAMGAEVKNYSFKTLEGTTTLKDLFAGQKQLMVIHNMGQGCRYCTLWADGLNGFLPHLESTMSVVLVSKDEPELQRRFANSRGWRFRTASHGGAGYIQEISLNGKQGNFPGVAVYEMKDSAIHLKNSATFGPYDQFCAFWSFLGLAGKSEENWSAQYNYWKAPAQLDDGGKNAN